jgi:hypothetical protein
MSRFAGSISWRGCAAERAVQRSFSHAVRTAQPMPANVPATGGEKIMRLESRFVLATLLAATGFVLTGGVQAAEQAVRAEEAAAKEASIPFANMGGLRDWKAVDDETLYVQDVRRNWYLAKLLAPCTDLTFATTIGFETKGVNQLDRFGAVIVRGQRCPLRSFVASGPPPRDAPQDAKAKPAE